MGVLGLEIRFKGLGSKVWNWDLGVGEPGTSAWGWKLGDLETWTWRLETGG